MKMIQKRFLNILCCVFIFLTVTIGLIGLMTGKLTPQNVFLYGGIILAVLLGAITAVNYKYNSYGAEFHKRYPNKHIK